MSDDILAAAVTEFNQGHYTRLLTSGLEFAENKAQSPGSFAAQAANRLVSFGVARGSLLPCPTPFVNWRRTSNSALAVHEALRSHDIKPKGINVLTAGPHGRETWVAYRRMLLHDAPVGIISIPVSTYNSAYWWTSSEGLRWVAKNVVGWPKEVLMGRGL